jgi:ABC-type nitrate/sulfonate/bicarbonate transport system substrate-binding protein
MNPKAIGIGSIAVALGLAVWFWGRQDTTPRTVRASELYSGTITIGTETWPGYIALYVAQEKDYFRDEGLNVVVRLYERYSQKLWMSDHQAATFFKPSTN